MSVANEEYYRAYKAKKYARALRESTFQYNILGPTSFASKSSLFPTGITRFTTRLRKGPIFIQAGFEGQLRNTVTDIGTLDRYQNVYLTQRNSGGCDIVNHIPLVTLFGGIIHNGDGFLDVPYIWTENEDMHFEIDNQTSGVFLSISLFGKNIK